MQPLEKAIDFAEQAILRTLAHFDMIDLQPEVSTPTNEPRSIHMTVLESKDHDDDRFEKEWRHLEEIPKGTVIGTRADGTEIVSSEDCVMLLPKHAAKAGQEWFYLGKF